jgi:hypothetical protein
MILRLSKRQIGFCGLAALLGGAAYFLFFWIVWGAAVDRMFDVLFGHEPARSKWVLDAGGYLLAFPFGFIPALRDGGCVVVNGIFWSAVAALACVWQCRRRYAA